MRSHFPSVPISVVIPAYNGEAHIRAALASVAAQTRPPAEVIVVDDGSYDRTADVASGLGARVIRFPENAGPAAARNAGVVAAHHPWIAFLDADDVWRRDKLETQWSALAHWPDAGYCFTDYDVEGTAGRICLREMAADDGYAYSESRERHGAAARFERGALAESLTRSMFIRQSSVVIRRSLFIDAGGYDERLRLSEDYDFFLRIVAAAPAVSIERPLVIYNRHERAISMNPIAEIASIERLWGKILDHPGPYPQAVVCVAASRRSAALRKGARKALRLGRFNNAIAFARRAGAGASPLTGLTVLGAACALNNALGRACFRGARALWRSRSRLWRRPAEAPVRRVHVTSRQNPLLP